MTLYRKYRPQTLSEVIGQESVTQVLTQALSTNKVAQAYLFAGSRGTGKTSVARIMAKALNCQKRIDSLENLPCNQCDSCQAITKGAFLDVVELDAASNRGIDEIRALKEQVNLSPAMGEYKVYILDEVHMLTTEAFNALLKTLEEPPSHVVFVLCTTESHKVPVTIASRCQRFVFQRATVPLLQTQLRAMAQAENLVVEDQALALLSELADGGYRDGAMLLEQMATQQETTDPITREAIELRLGLANQALMEQLIQHLMAKQTDASIKVIEEFVSRGGEARYLMTSLISQLRLLLLAKLSPSAITTIATAEQQKWLESVSKDASVDYLLTLVRLLVQAQQAKPSDYPALPLELAIAQANQPEAPAQAQPVAPGVVVSAAAPSASSPPIAQPTRPATTASVQIASPPKAAPVASPAPATTSADHPEQAPAPVQKIVVVETPAELQAQWLKILDTIRPQSRSVEALLRDCTPLSFDGTILMLQFWYAFHKKQLEMEKNRSLVEQVATSIMGTNVRIKCQLGDKSARPPKQPMAEEDIKNVVGQVEEANLIDAAAEIFGGEFVEDIPS